MKTMVVTVAIVSPALFGCGSVGQTGGGSSTDASVISDGDQRADSGRADAPDAACVADAGGPSASQCVVNTDCATGSCNPAWPGGLCLGCAIDDHCPRGTVCFDTVCRAPCRSDADCFPGLECQSCSCGLKRCTGDLDCGGSSACVADPAIGDRYCGRRPCSDTIGCPVGSSCRDSLRPSIGRVRVEDP